uniref:NADH dehydrogenase subunit 4L n=1 Tax=Diostrombus politus TaxID=130564 RepID=UPI002A7FEA28|nr:NADH dehydrogenase subunit 4L [Diostrombus politus]WOW99044.1 NADH dehydrogenase subunit 4L [Diostrombus politus]
MIFCVFIFISGLVGLMVVRKHYLLSLLMLEFFLISLFFLGFTYFSFYSYDYFFSIVYLVFSVCDGVLGLSLLVYVVRKTSNDYFTSMNLL